MRNSVGRIRRRLRREVVRRAGMDFGRNYFLDSMIADPRADVERVGVVSAATTVPVRFDLGGWDDITYSFPERHVYALPEAIVDPVQNYVYDREGHFVAESAAEGLYRLCLEGVDLKARRPAKRMAGEWLSFGLSPNIYHGLLQDLPAFLAAAEARPDLPVLARKTTFEPALAILDRIGERRIEWIEEPVRVERLIMGGKTAGQGKPYHYSNVHPADLARVRDWIAAAIPPSPTAGPKAIYVSRSRARRAMANEADLDVALADAGIDVFHGSMSFIDQIHHFRDAKLVAGPNGAGLTHLIWMPPDGVVRMLPFQGFRAHFYVELARYMNHDFEWYDVPNDSWSDREIARFRDHLLEAVAGS